MPQVCTHRTESVPGLGKGSTRHNAARISSALYRNTLHGASNSQQNAGIAAKTLVETLAGVASAPADCCVRRAATRACSCPTRSTQMPTVARTLRSTPCFNSQWPLFGATRCESAAHLTGAAPAPYIHLIELDYCTNYSQDANKCATVSRKYVQSLLTQPRCLNPAS